MKPVGKLPAWLKRPLPASEKYKKTEGILKSLKLETICTNAHCPNRGECWNRGTATVLILGNVCTRNCKFCSVGTGTPEPVDKNEPAKLATMAKEMKLKYLVITSVNRDDLSDGGAEHFAACVQTVRKEMPDMKFEILVPDFRGCEDEALEILEPAMPFVFAHNVETVPSLYPVARTGGNYKKSLELLGKAKKFYGKVKTKSSIMLGLGETEGQVVEVLKDLRNVGVDRVTIGQYLRPSKESLEVKEYVTPERFDEWKAIAKGVGFKWVMSSPFTRSSYFAELENA